MEETKDYNHEHHKEKEHSHEHKVDHKTDKHHSHEHKSKDTNYCLFAAIALAILLVASVATHGFRGCPIVGAATDVITTDEDVITIYEYSEFECPFCKKGMETIEEVKEEYGDQVKVIFKHFPLSFHQYAQKASEASECARDQDQFWEMHDKLFANNQKLTVSDIKGYAKELSLDTDKFDTCLDSGEKADKVAADMQEGKDKGVTGTPAFFIGDEMLVGAQPLSAFKKIIDKALGKEVEPDVEIKLIIVNDKECSQCDSSQVESALNQMFTLNIAKVDYNSEEGKELVEKYDIKALPAYIFDSNVEKADNYDKVQQALIKKDTSYLVHPAAAGSAKYLETPPIEDDPYQGPKDAKVTIIEFSDYECPFCKKGYDTMQQVKKEYEGKIKIIFKDFPLSFHQHAQKAAEASQCANDQNKFWAMHDWMFEHQDKLDVASLKEQAETFGLDTTKFNDCLDSGKYADEVAEDMQHGQEFGVTGTPAFFINGIKLGGAQPFEAFKAVIDAELE